MPPLRVLIGHLNIEDHESEIYITFLKVFEVWSHSHTLRVTGESSETSEGVGEGAYLAEPSTCAKVGSVTVLAQCRVVQISSPSFFLIGKSGGHAIKRHRGIAAWYASIPPDRLLVYTVGEKTGCQVALAGTWNAAICLIRLSETISQALSVCLC